MYTVLEFNCYRYGRISSSFLFNRTIHLTMAYILNTKEESLTSLDNYKFLSEGNHPISPQIILAKHPELLTDLIDLDLGDVQIPLIIRELSTSSGAIDILYITANSDIVLVETKLFRNPESHRVVVAQCIDYIKALSKASVDQILDKAIQSPYSDKDFKPDDFFHAAVGKNLTTGNFKVVIAGDKIHPNILEMVDSIQSAPHLSFSIYLIELQPKFYTDEMIYLSPRCIAKTFEVERSVIRLEVSKTGDVTIESSIPEKESKGTRPILTEEEYLNNLEKPEFVLIVSDFLKEWRSKGGDVRYGTVGFSAGMVIGDKRIPIQFVYQKMIAIISDKWRNIYGISDESYERYKEYFKDQLPEIYDKYIVGNRVEVKFSELSEDEFRKTIFGAFEIVE